MTTQTPLNVSGLEPDIRDEALHVAHASGKTLGQWMNGVIRNSIAEKRAEAQAFATLAGANMSHSMVKQETAGTPMTHYPAQQPTPHPAYYHAGAAPMMPPPYAMPGYPAPYAPAQVVPPAYAYPPPPAFDPIEQRLRAYAMAGRETAISPVPTSDERILKVIDAAVRATENKTAAAIDALATLIDKQRKADVDAQMRLQAESQMREQAEEAAKRSLAQHVQSETTEVSQVLTTLVDRLNGLEQSVAAATTARSEESLAQAKALEERIGQALEALTPHLSAPVRTAEAADDNVQHGEEDAVQAAPLPVIQGVRPPPRPQARPRITVPRSSGAVAEIAARQRMLDAGHDYEPRQQAEGSALDAIRRSIAALSDQMRDSARMRVSKSENDIREDMKELQRAVQQLAPRQIVSSINDSIRMLAQKIEQSREEGVRESQLAPVESVLNEIRSNLMEMREPRGLSTINETLGLLARRVEMVGERSIDNEQLTQIQQQMAELRSIVIEARKEQPVDGLNAQIRSLADKLDTASERPRDTKAMLLLAEAVEDVRKSLRKVDPEAMVARLEDKLSGIESLERRIEALSRFLTDHGKLQVMPAGLDGLTERIEQMTQALGARSAEPDFSPILKRIDAMQQSFEQRPQGGADVSTLEAILRRLADRIEDMRAPGSGNANLDELQAQMTHLAERLDRTTPGNSGLGGLEKTLADLCQKVSSLEDTTVSAAKDVARSTAMGGGGGIDPLAAEGMLLIKRDLTEMKSAQAEAEVRSRDVLQQVNNSLEKIVTRLTSLEADMSRPAAVQMPLTVSTPAPAPAPVRAAVQQQAVSPMAMRAPVVAEPPPAQASTAPVPVSAAAANVGRPAPALARGSESKTAAPKTAAPMAAAPMPAPTQAGEAAPVRAQAKAVQAPAVKMAESDLDLPLEPGVRTPTPVIGDDGHADPRSAFIAAARRAAQAAQAQTALAIEEEEKNKKNSLLGGRFDDIKTAVSARRKPILLGVAALMVVLGGMKVATQFLEGDAPALAPTPVAEATQAAPAQEAAENKQAEVVAQAAPVAEAPVAAQPRTIPLTAPTEQQAMVAPATPDVAALLKATSYAVPEKLKQAALTGNASAAYEIGARLAEARNGASRDIKAAAQWIEYAANQGLPLAQYRLGSFHREGLGVGKDNKAAFALFQKAAQQGNILAMHNLAVLHAEGVNGTSDYAAAAQWFRNAAEHGVKDSQFNIAVLYLQGLGVANDLGESFKWFSAAARQGDQDAVKRRDGVLAKIPADKAEAAKQAAEAFRAKRPDPRANDIVVPEGGWDDKRLPSMVNRRAKSV